MQTKYTQTKLAATASPYVAHSCPSRKKSKRKRDEAEAKARVKEGVAQYESRYGSGEDEVESGKEVSERDGGGKNDGEEGDGVDDMLTPAQRRFRDKQLAREVSDGTPLFSAPTRLIVLGIRLGVSGAGLFGVLAVDTDRARVHGTMLIRRKMNHSNTNTSELQYHVTPPFRTTNFLTSITSQYLSILLA